MQIEPVDEPRRYESPSRSSLVAQIKDIDARRPDFPGEHIIVFGVGVLLMLSGMRSRTLLRRTLVTAAGTALIGRAASGTGGIARVARIVKRLG
ncbi:MULTISPECIES: hypothetical protein [Achromobacter]|uniref:Uncharacterized protein n=1 Tax=Achromobacter animicus TaxID=1389935 RepID=A0A6S6Z513_9BURK|nr:MULTISPECIES: hypothetical protein [Achromobacter]MCG7326132.1 hypothetical protein [Achromobacter sp. ACRQX]MDH0681305.1 hypothetical protein [Achromobacter animicus]CAB3658199.1 hypothetical protein LMG26690_00423 [Achromobacter animicus]CAB3819586.1 hypothetical protein LMG26691_00413 [Achromobacter animicus]CAB3868997.1 hypothetical protein LMG26689_02883 [Achromobacter animicus]